MPSIYIGSSSDSLSRLIERAEEAYSQGCNSLAMRDWGSFHDPVHFFYAFHRESGRQVRNPAGWLERAREKAFERECQLWKLSRRSD